MIEMYIYSHCLRVAITTPEGGSWRYPHIKISHPARKGWPRHRGVHPLFLSNSGVGSFTSHKNHIRRASRINTDRFPKGGPKAQASGGGIVGAGSPFNSPFLGFRVIQTGHWPDFNLKIYLLWKSWPISVKRLKPVWIRSGRWVKALWDGTGLRFFILIRED